MKRRMQSKMNNCRAAKKCKKSTKIVFKLNLELTSNYKPGLRKIASVVCPGINIKPQALVILNEIMNFMNGGLIEYSIRQFKPKEKKKEMGLNIARGAIEAFFPSTTRDHAFAECNKAILRFKNGLLNYKYRRQKSFVRRRTAKKARKSRSIMREQEFSKGLQAIVRNTYAAAGIDTKARNALSQLLNGLLDVMIRKMKETVESSGDVTEQTVMELTQSLFPPTLANHAKAEGAKMTLLQLFIPKVTKRKRKKDLSDKLKIEAADKKRKKKRKSLSKSSWQMRKRQKLEEIINYIPSLRKTVTLVHPGMRIKRDAYEVISACLNTLNNDFVDHVAKFKPSKKCPKMTVDVAKEAIKSAVRKEVCSHAFANAEKAVMHFNAGLLSYRYKSKGKSTCVITKKAKKTKRVKDKHPGYEEFNKGWLNIVRMVYPEAHIDQSSKYYVSQMLHGLLNHIMIKMDDLNPQSVTEEEVKKAAFAVLPPVMADHAAAEGSKMMLFYENQEIIFHPPLVKRRRLKSPKLDFVVQLTSKSQKRPIEG